MVEDNHDRDDVPPTDEPPLRASPSVADVPPTMLPTIDLGEGPLYAAQGNAERFVTDGGCDSRKGTVIGQLGENVFKQYVPKNLEMDTEVRPSGDIGWDFKYGGLRWDIKTVGRHRTEPSLTVDACSRLRADRYALVNRIGKTVFRLVGYTNHARVKEQGIRLSEHGAYRLVERDQLIPFPQYLSGN